MNTEHPIRVETVPPAPNGTHSAAQATQARPVTTQTPLIDIHEGPEGLVLEANTSWRGAASEGSAGRSS